MAEKQLPNPEDAAKGVEEARRALMRQAGTAAVIAPQEARGAAAVRAAVYDAEAKTKPVVDALKAFATKLDLGRDRASTKRELDSIIPEQLRKEFEPQISQVLDIAEAAAKAKATGHPKAAEFEEAAQQAVKALSRIIASVAKLKAANANPELIENAKLILNDFMVGKDKTEMEGYRSRGEEALRWLELAANHSPALGSKSMAQVNEAVNQTLSILAKNAGRGTAEEAKQNARSANAIFGNATKAVTEYEDLLNKSSAAAVQEQIGQIEVMLHRNVTDSSMKSQLETLHNDLTALHKRLLEGRASDLEISFAEARVSFALKAKETLGNREGPAVAAEEAMIGRGMAALKSAYTLASMEGYVSNPDPAQRLSVKDAARRSLGDVPETDPHVAQLASEFEKAGADRNERMAKIRDFTVTAQIQGYMLSQYTEGGREVKIQAKKASEELAKGNLTNEQAIGFLSTVYQAKLESLTGPRGVKDEQARASISRMSKQSASSVDDLARMSQIIKTAADFAAQERRLAGATYSSVREGALDIYRKAFFAAESGAPLDAVLVQRSLAERYIAARGDDNKDIRKYILGMSTRLDNAVKLQAMENLMSQQDESKRPKDAASAAMAVLGATDKEDARVKALVAEWGKAGATKEERAAYITEVVRQGCTFKLLLDRKEDMERLAERSKDPDFAQDTLYSNHISGIVNSLAYLSEGNPEKIKSYVKKTEEDLTLLAGGRGQISAIFVTGKDPQKIRQQMIESSDLLPVNDVLGTLKPNSQERSDVANIYNMGFLTRLDPAKSEEYGAAFFMLAQAYAASKDKTERAQILRLAKQLFDKTEDKRTPEQIAALPPGERPPTPEQGRWLARLYLDRSNAQSEIKNKAQRQNHSALIALAEQAYLRGDQRGAEMITKMATMYGKAASAPKSDDPAVKSVLAMPKDGIPGQLPSLSALQAGMKSEPPKTVAQILGFPAEQAEARYNDLDLALTPLDVDINSAAFTSTRIDLDSRKVTTRFASEQKRIAGKIKKAERRGDTFTANMLRDDAATLDLPWAKARLERADANYREGAAKIKEAAGLRRRAIAEGDEARLTGLYARYKKGEKLEGDELAAAQEVAKVLEPKGDKATDAEVKAALKIVAQSRSQKLGAQADDLTEKGTLLMETAQTERDAIAGVQNNTTRVNTGRGERALGSYRRAALGSESVAENVRAATGPLSRTAVTILDIRSRKAQTELGVGRYITQGEVNLQEAQWSLLQRANKLDDKNEENNAKYVARKTKDGGTLPPIMLPDEKNKGLPSTKQAYNYEQNKKNIAAARSAANSFQIQDASRLLGRAEGFIKVDEQRAQISINHYQKLRFASQGEQDTGRMTDFNTFDLLRQTDEVAALVDQNRFAEADRRLKTIGDDVITNGGKQDELNRAGGAAFYKRVAQGKEEDFEELGVPKEVARAEREKAKKENREPDFVGAFESYLVNREKLDAMGIKTKKIEDDEVAKAKKEGRPPNFVQAYADFANGTTEESKAVIAEAQRRLEEAKQKKQMGLVKGGVAIAAAPFTGMLSLSYFFVGGDEKKEGEGPAPRMPDVEKIRAQIEILRFARGDAEKAAAQREGRKPNPDALVVDNMRKSARELAAEMQGIEDDCLRARAAIKGPKDVAGFDALPGMVNALVDLENARAQRTSRGVSDLRDLAVVTNQSEVDHLNGLIRSGKQDEAMAYLVARPDLVNSATNLMVSRGQMTEAAAMGLRSQARFNAGVARFQDTQRGWGTNQLAFQEAITTGDQTDRMERSERGGEIKLEISIIRSHMGTMISLARAAAKDPRAVGVAVRTGAEITLPGLSDSEGRGALVRREEDHIDTETTMGNVALRGTIRLSSSERRISVEGAFREAINGQVDTLETINRSYFMGGYHAPEGAEPKDAEGQAFKKQFISQYGADAWRYVTGYHRSAKAVTDANVIAIMGTLGVTTAVDGGGRPQVTNLTPQESEIALSRALDQVNQLKEALVQTTCGSTAFVSAGNRANISDTVTAAATKIIGYEQQESGEWKRVGMLNELLTRAQYRKPGDIDTSETAMRASEAALRALAKDMDGVAKVSGDRISAELATAAVRDRRWGYVTAGAKIAGYGVMAATGFGTGVAVVGVLDTYMSIRDQQRVAGGWNQMTPLTQFGAQLQIVGAWGGAAAAGAGSVLGMAKEGLGATKFITLSEKALSSNWVAVPMLLVNVTAGGLQSYEMYMNGGSGIDAVDIMFSFGSGVLTPAGQHWLSVAVSKSPRVSTFLETRTGALGHLGRGFAMVMGVNMHQISTARAAGLHEMAAVARNTASEHAFRAAERTPQGMRTIHETETVLKRPLRIEEKRALFDPISAVEAHLGHSLPPEDVVALTQHYSRPGAKPGETQVVISNPAEAAMLVDGYRKYVDAQVKAAGPEVALDIARIQVDGNRTFDPGETLALVRQYGDKMPSANEAIMFLETRKITAEKEKKPAFFTLSDYANLEATRKQLDAVAKPKPADARTVAAEALARLDAAAKRREHADEVGSAAASQAKQRGISDPAEVQAIGKRAQELDSQYQRYLEGSREIEPGVETFFEGIKSQKLDPKKTAEQLARYAAAESREGSINRAVGEELVLSGGRMGREQQRETDIKSETLASGFRLYEEAKLSGNEAGMTRTMQELKRVLSLSDEQVTALTARFEGFTKAGVTPESIGKALVGEAMSIKTPEALAESVKLSTAREAAAEREKTGIELQDQFKTEHVSGEEFYKKINGKNYTEEHANAAIEIATAADLLARRAIAGETITRTDAVIEMRRVMGAEAKIPAGMAEAALKLARDAGFQKATANRDRQAQVGQALEESYKMPGLRVSKDAVNAAVAPDAMRLIDNPNASPESLRKQATAEAGKAAELRGQSQSTKRKAERFAKGSRSREMLERIAERQALNADAREANSRVLAAEAGARTTARREAFRNELGAAVGKEAESMHGLIPKESIESRANAISDAYTNFRANKLTEAEAKRAGFRDLKDAQQFMRDLDRTPAEAAKKIASRTTGDLAAIESRKNFTPEAVARSVKAEEDALVGRAKNHQDYSDAEASMRSEAAKWERRAEQKLSEVYNLEHIAKSPALAQEARETAAGYQRLSEAYKNSAERLSRLGSQKREEAVLNIANEMAKKLPEGQRPAAIEEAKRVAGAFDALSRGVPDAEVMRNFKVNREMLEALRGRLQSNPEELPGELATLAVDKQAAGRSGIANRIGDMSQRAVTGDSNKYVATIMEWLGRRYGTNIPKEEIPKPGATFHDTIKSSARALREMLQKARENLGFETDLYSGFNKANRDVRAGSDLVASLSEHGQMPREAQPVGVIVLDGAKTWMKNGESYAGERYQNHDRAHGGRELGDVGLVIYMEAARRFQERNPEVYTKLQTAEGDEVVLMIRGDKLGANQADANAAIKRYGENFKKVLGEVAREFGMDPKSPLYGALADVNAHGGIVGVRQGKDGGQTFHYQGKEYRDLNGALVSLEVEGSLRDLAGRGATPAQKAENAATAGNIRTMITDVLATRPESRLAQLNVDGKKQVDPDAFATFRFGFEGTLRRDVARLAENNGKGYAAAQNGMAGPSVTNQLGHPFTDAMTAHFQDAIVKALKARGLEGKVDIYVDGPMTFAFKFKGEVDHETFNSAISEAAQNFPALMRERGVPVVNRATAASRIVEPVENIRPTTWEFQNGRWAQRELSPSERRDAAEKKAKDRMKADIYGGLSPYQARARGAGDILGSLISNIHLFGTQSVREIFTERGTGRLMFDESVIAALEKIPSKKWLRTPEDLLQHFRDSKVPEASIDAFFQQMGHEHAQRAAEALPGAKPPAGTGFGIKGEAAQAVPLAATGTDSGAAPAQRGGEAPAQRGGEAPARVSERMTPEQNRLAQSIGNTPDAITRLASGLATGNKSAELVLRQLGDHPLRKVIEGVAKNPEFLEAVRKGDTATIRRFQSEVAASPMRYFGEAEFRALHPEPEGTQIYHNQAHTENTARAAHEITAARETTPQDAAVFGADGTRVKKAEFVAQVAMLHDIDPSAARKPGTPASVARTLEWMDSAQGQSIMRTSFGWDDTKITIAKAMIARTDFPFSPAAEARYVGLLQSLQKVGKGEPAAVAAREAPVLSEYADKSSWYYQRPADALASVRGLNNEIASVTPPGKTPPDMLPDTHGFVSKIGEAAAFEADVRVATQLGIDLGGGFPPSRDAVLAAMPEAKRNFDANVEMFRLIAQGTHPNIARARAEVIIAQREGGQAPGTAAPAAQQARQEPLKAPGISQSPTDAQRGQFRHSQLPDRIYTGEQVARADLARRIAGGEPVPENAPAGIADLAARIKSHPDFNKKGPDAEANRLRIGLAEVDREHASAVVEGYLNSRPVADQMRVRQTAMELYDVLEGRKPMPKDASPEFKNAVEGMRTGQIRPGEVPLAVSEAAMSIEYSRSSGSLERAAAKEPKAVGELAKKLMEALYGRRTEFTPAEEKLLFDTLGKINSAVSSGKPDHIAVIEAAREMAGMLPAEQKAPAAPRVEQAPREWPQAALEANKAQIEADIQRSIATRAGKEKEPQPQGMVTNIEEIKAGKVFRVRIRTPDGRETSAIYTTTDFRQQQIGIAMYEAAGERGVGYVSFGKTALQEDVGQMTFARAMEKATPAERAELLRLVGRQGFIDFALGIPDSHGENYIVTKTEAGWRINRIDFENSGAGWGDPGRYFLNYHHKWAINMKYGLDISNYTPGELKAFVQGIRQGIEAVRRMDAGKIIESVKGFEGVPLKRGDILFTPEMREAVGKRIRDIQNDPEAVRRDMLSNLYGAVNEVARGARGDLENSAFLKEWAGVMKGEVQNADLRTLLNWSRDTRNLVDLAKGRPPEEVRELAAAIDGRLGEMLKKPLTGKEMAIFESWSERLPKANIKELGELRRDIENVSKIMGANTPEKVRELARKIDAEIIRKLGEPVPEGADLMLVVQWRDVALRITGSDQPEAAKSAREIEARLASEIIKRSKDALAKAQPDDLQQMRENIRQIARTSEGETSATARAVESDFTERIMRGAVKRGGKKASKGKGVEDEIAILKPEIAGAPTKVLEAVREEIRQSAHSKRFEEISRLIESELASRKPPPEGGGPGGKGPGTKPEEGGTKPAEKPPTREPGAGPQAKGGARILGAGRFGPAANDNAVAPAAKKPRIVSIQEAARLREAKAAEAAKAHGQLAPEQTPAQKAAEAAYGISSGADVATFARRIAQGDKKALELYRDMDPKVKVEIRMRLADPEFREAAKEPPVGTMDVMFPVYVRKNRQSLEESAGRVQRRMDELTPPQREAARRFGTDNAPVADAVGTAMAQPGQAGRPGETTRTVAMLGDRAISDTVIRGTVDAFNAAGTGTLDMSQPNSRDIARMRGLVKQGMKPEEAARVALEERPPASRAELSPKARELFDIAEALLSGDLKRLRKASDEMNRLPQNEQDAIRYMITEGSEYKSGGHPERLLLAEMLGGDINAEAAGKPREIPSKENLEKIARLADDIVNGDKDAKANAKQKLAEESILFTPEEARAFGRFFRAMNIAPKRVPPAEYAAEYHQVRLAEAPTPKPQKAPTPKVFASEAEFRAHIDGIRSEVSYSGQYVDRISNSKKVVAIGDVHGDVYGAVDQLLRSGVLIDTKPNLPLRDGSISPSERFKINPALGRDSDIVFMGDLIDRGPTSIEAVDFVRRLQSDAKAAGIRVHTIRGNHEELFLKFVAAHRTWSTAKVLDAIESRIAPAFDLVGGWKRIGIGDTFESILNKYAVNGDKSKAWEAFIKANFDPQGRVIPGGEIDFLTRTKGAVIIDNNYFTHAGPVLNYIPQGETKPVPVRSPADLNAHFKGMFEASENGMTRNMSDPRDIARGDYSIDYASNWVDKFDTDGGAWRQAMGVDHVYVGHERDDSGVGIRNPSRYVTNLDVAMSERYGGGSGILIIDPLNKAMPVTIAERRGEVPASGNRAAKPAVDNVRNHTDITLEDGTLILRSRTDVLKNDVSQAAENFFNNPPPAQATPKAPSAGGQPKLAPVVDTETAMGIPKGALAERNVTVLTDRTGAPKKVMGVGNTEYNEYKVNVGGAEITFYLPANTRGDALVASLDNLPRLEPGKAHPATEWEAAGSVIKWNTALEMEFQNRASRDVNGKLALDQTAYESLRPLRAIGRAIDAIARSSIPESQIPSEYLPAIRRLRQAQSDPKITEEARAGMILNEASNMIAERYKAARPSMEASDVATVLGTPNHAQTGDAVIAFTKHTAEKQDSVIRQLHTWAEMKEAEATAHTAAGRNGEASVARNYAETLRHQASALSEMKSLIGPTGQRLERELGLPAGTLRDAYMYAPSIEAARKAVFDRMGITLGNYKDDHMAGMLLTGDLAGILRGLHPGAASMEMKYLGGGATGAFVVNVVGSDGVTRREFVKKVDMRADQAGARNLRLAGIPAPDVIATRADGSPLQYAKPDGTMGGFGISRDIAAYTETIVVNGKRIEMVTKRATFLNDLLKSPEAMEIFMEHPEIFYSLMGHKFAAEFATGSIDGHGGNTALLSMVPKDASPENIAAIRASGGKVQKVITDPDGTTRLVNVELNVYTDSHGETSTVQNGRIDTDDSAGTYWAEGQRGNFDFSRLHTWLGSHHVFPQLFLGLTRTYNHQELSNAQAYRRFEIPAASERSYRDQGWNIVTDGGKRYVESSNPQDAAALQAVGLAPDPAYLNGRTPKFVSPMQLVERAFGKWNDGPFFQGVKRWTGEFQYDPAYRRAMQQSFASYDWKPAGVSSFPVFDPIRQDQIRTDGITYQTFPNNGESRMLAYSTDGRTTLPSDYERVRGVNTWDPTVQAMFPQNQFMWVAPVPSADYANRMGIPVFTNGNKTFGVFPRYESVPDAIRPQALWAIRHHENLRAAPGFGHTTALPTERLGATSVFEYLTDPGANRISMELKAVADEFRAWERNNEKVLDGSDPAKKLQFIHERMPGGFGPDNFPTRAPPPP